MKVLLKSKTIIKPQTVLYPVGKKGVKLTCHGYVSNESLLLPFLNAQKPSLLETFLDQHKAHLFGLLLGCEAGFQSFFPVSENWQKQDIVTFRGEGEGSFQKEELGVGADTGG